MTIGMNDFSPMMTGRDQSPEVGASVYKLLRVSPSDLAFSKQTDKLAEIIDFASGFEDAIYLMKMAMSKKPSDVSPIDFIHGYVSLQRDRVNYTKKMSQIKKELAMYE